jgi:hypothetical protein
VHYLANKPLARDDVLEPAKGVLFGNAYRLLPLVDRGTFFTEKCMSAAKRSGTTLVTTPDLFTTAQYLSGEPNEDFAKECRRAILESGGKIVNFPKPPASIMRKTGVKEIDGDAKVDVTDDSARGK